MVLTATVLRKYYPRHPWQGVHGVFSLVNCLTTILHSSTVIVFGYDLSIFRSPWPSTQLKAFFGMAK